MKKLGLGRIDEDFCVWLSEWHASDTDPWTVICKLAGLHCHKTLISSAFEFLTLLYLLLIISVRSCIFALVQNSRFQLPGRGEREYLIFIFFKFFQASASHVSCVPFSTSHSEDQLCYIAKGVMYPLKYLFSSSFSCDFPWWNFPLTQHIFFKSLSCARNYVRHL